MRKIIAVFLVVILFLITSCSIKEHNHSINNTDTESDHSINDTDTETDHSKENDTLRNNCKLIVNGKDISDKNYVRIDLQNREAELPLTAILKEFGAEINWKDSKTVEITYEEENLILGEGFEDLGLPIPPGTTNAVRKIIDNELIVDSTSAQDIFFYVFGAKINTDYDALIVYVEKI